jgi:hypothetical protein
MSDQDKPDLMNDPIVQSAMKIEGYQFLRKLPSGEWAALMRFMFTMGLVVGIDLVGYRTRYCYEFDDEALDALLQWDGHGDPPGPWIKEKGREGERIGPGTKGRFA